MQLEYYGWCHWKEDRIVNQNPALTQKVIFLLNTHYVRSGHIFASLRFLAPSSFRTETQGLVGGKHGMPEDVMYEITNMNTYEHVWCVKGNERWLTWHILLNFTHILLNFTHILLHFTHILHSFYIYLTLPDSLLFYF